MVRGEPRPHPRHGEDCHTRTLAAVTTSALTSTPLFIIYKTLHSVTLHNNITDSRWMVTTVRWPSSDTYMTLALFFPCAGIGFEKIVDITLMLLWNTTVSFMPGAGISIFQVLLWIIAICVATESLVYYSKQCFSQLLD